MRTSTPTVSFVSSLVAVALAIAPYHGAVAAPATEPPAEAPATAPDSAEAPTVEAEPAEPVAEPTPEEAAAARVTAIDTGLATAKTKVADAKTKLEAAKAADAKPEDVDAAINGAEVDVGEAKTAVGEAKAAVEDSKSAIADQKTALEEAKLALPTKRKKKDKVAAEAAIADSEATIAAAEAALADTETAIGEVDASITEVETAIGEARTEADAKAAAAAEAAAKAAAEKASYVPEEDDRPPEPRIGNKPATGKGLMIAGGTVAGVGLGLTIAFSLMTRKCDIDGPLQCRLQNQDDFLIPMGAATLLTGTMLLGVGLGYFLRYKRWQRWTPEDGTKRAALLPTATRTSAGLALVGRF